jgi:glycyl-tRNA synthetase beta chain
VSATLLVELLTEELPPKSLRLLSDRFGASLLEGLVKAQLKTRGADDLRVFATPRRLAASIRGVAERGADRDSRVSGPSSKAPAAALEGFARKHGLRVEQLEREQTQKGEIVVAKVSIKGADLEAALPGLVAEALAALPIPKLMRWGNEDVQFVRPVHGLVMLHGERVVPGSVLGQRSASRTRGHRFMGAGEITLGHAEEYETRLLEEGKVLADFGKRRSEIDRQLQAKALERQASLGSYEDLLDEVTALVEHPNVYEGSFEAAYLKVPQECLILTMRQNQKYFPLFDRDGKLLSRFLIVSNMKVADPRHIVGGNERVVRPRLEDARFFYEQDRRERLESRVPGLAKVVYHGKLGSQLERVQRIQLLAGAIARKLGADAAAAERAAWLSKADLLTGMVGEFPELQGVMGRYYALHDGEPRPVAEAIEAHYRPRFAGDRLPQDGVASALALADRLDTLAGLFSIGEHPTGDKDPYGLRRAALGVVRIIVENELDLSLHEVVNEAFAPFKGKAQTDLEIFIYERFAGYLKELGYSTVQVDAVLSQNPVRLNIVPRQLEAVKAFEALPEAESLAAANKRVANILRQAEAKGELFSAGEVKGLKEPAEQALLDALKSTASSANSLFERGDYAGYLRSFAVLKSPVDAFFDKVMVMAEDEALRRSRLALLKNLRDAMNRVADISKLAK